MMMPLKKLLKSAKFKMCANRETKIEIKYLEAKTKGKKAVQANCKGEREKKLYIIIREAITNITSIRLQRGW